MMYRAIVCALVVLGVAAGRCPGTCQDDSRSCSGTYRSGLCPGASNIRCCTSSSGGSSGGSSYTDKIPLPPGLRNQNGHTYLKQTTMKSIFGNPCPLRRDCGPVTNRNLAAQHATEDVGPFRATGLKVMLRALRNAFTKLRRDKPDLYNVLSSAGGLCCRAVRGSNRNWSNHAWGAAIDIKVAGVLDPRRDGKALRGLMEIYPYLNAEGFFWAAGYSASAEDAMHFELSEQTIQRTFGGGSSTGGGSSSRCPGRCQDDRGFCSGTYYSGLCSGGRNNRCCY